MSSAAPPSSTAPDQRPRRAAPAGAPAARAHRWRTLRPLPLPPGWDAYAITLGVASILAGAAFVQGAGSSLGPKTVTEIGLLLIGGTLVVSAGVRGRAAGTPGTGVAAVALLAAFAALSALSISWALNPSDAWLAANQLVAYVAALAGAVALARLAPASWPSVIGGVVLAAVLVCGYGLLTKALPAVFNEVEFFARLRSPFGYWNAVGLAGVLAIPACLWLGARREGSPVVHALAYPALTVCLSTTLMAYSRGALAAALAGLALWFTLSPMRLRGAAVLVGGGAGATMIGLWAFGQDALTTDRTPLAERSAAGLELLVLLVTVLSIVFVVGLVANFATDLRPLGDRTRRRVGVALLLAAALSPLAAAGALTTTDRGLQGSIADAWRSLTDTKAVGPANDPSRLTATGSVRSRYWEQAFQAWESEKAFGVGAGSYATARLRYREDLLDVRHAHGFVPETMAELGIAGISVALALLVAWVLAARQAIRGTGPGTPQRAGVVTLVAIAVIFGAHSLIDLTWTIPGVALVGLVCAGWVAGFGNGSAATPVSIRSRRWSIAVAAGAALLVVAGSWSAWQPLRAARAADAGFAALEEGNLSKARAHMRTARERNPLSIEPLLDRAAVERRAGRKRAVEDALEEATRVQPANWVPWFQLADHRLFELDDPRGAMHAIRVAIYLNPQSWDITQRFVDIHRRLNARKS